MRVLEITKKNGERIYGLVMKDKRVVIDIHCGILQYLPDFNLLVEDFYYNSKTCHNKNIHVCKDEDILNKFKDMYMYIKKRDYFLKQMQKSHEFVNLFDKKILSKFLEISDIEKKRKEEERKIIEELKLKKKEYEFNKLIESVTGNETFYYSFCGKSEVSHEYALAVAMKSSRQFYYRYGYAYRGAEKRPITKEEAIRRIRERGQIDVKARESYIEVNEFSENDMW